MGEVSSDTPEAIGRRLAEALVEQVSDLGIEGEEFVLGLLTAARVVTDRIRAEFLGLTRQQEEQDSSGSRPEEEVSP